MRKHFLILILIVAASFSAKAQGAKGVKIGYIDMEYILQNVPDYTDAKNQLEQKAQKWKQEIEVKKNEITKLKESLKTERVLLTKELIEEREESIAFLETELSEFQQKKFGPTGDLVVQKAVLVKPIQDQVFTAVQDLVEQRKYDFVFDKSSDLTMLFAAKRYDISDIVIRKLTRASKASQMSKKQIKEEEAKEAKEDLEDLNPAIAERKKLLEEKKAAREKLIEDRKVAAEAKKAEFAAKREQMIADRNAKKNGTTTASPKDTKSVSNDKKNDTDSKVVASSDNNNDKKAANDLKIEQKKATIDSIANAKEIARKAALDAKAKTIEDRKKAIEEKKAKILADREAAKKEKEEKAKETKPKTE